MELEEVHRILRECTADDWHSIICWGAPSGPSFLADLGNPGDIESETTWFQTHGMRAVWRADVSLGLAWGIDMRMGTLRPPWAEATGDPEVSGFWVDVLSCGMLVDRFLLYSVDGARAALPAPKATYTERVDGDLAKPTAVEKWTVTRLRLAVARLVADLDGRPNDFEGYLSMVGFEVEP